MGNTETTTDTGARMGRPRSHDRTLAILDAASELLDEIGYDRIRIQDVADRAGASLATIYRRWGTKETLIAAALRHRVHDYQAPHSGDPKSKLAGLISDLADDFGSTTELLPGLLSAMRDQPELAEAVRVSLIDTIRTQSAETVGEIIGADHPKLDLIADIAPGILLFRTMFGDDLDTQSIASELVELILEFSSDVGRDT